MAPVAAVAAEDCQAEPTGDKLDGQHWYYRFDRNSNRRCWYLKDTAGNVRDATKDSVRDTAPRPSSSQPASAWDFAQPTPPKFAPRRADDTGKNQTGAGTSSVVRTRPSAASFDANLQRDMPAAPWQPPQTQSLDSADIDTPSAAAPLTAAADPATEMNSAAAPTVADSAASARPVKPTAPIHKLLMVVIGALSLSGLLASAQYRLSKAGRARRRDRNWQRAIARARRNRDKPRKKAGPAGSRAVKTPAIAAAPAAAVRVRQPPPAIAGAVELPPAIVVRPAKTPEPAVERADLTAARAKTSTAKPAAVAKASPQKTAAFDGTRRPAEPARAVERPAAVEIVDPAAELVDLLGSHAAKMAVQQAVQQPQQSDRPAGNAAPASQSPETATPRLPGIEDPEAELANLLESRFAPPSARHVANGPADRSNDGSKDRSQDRPKDLSKPKAPVAPVAAAARKVVDPITELADLLEAKETKRAARLAKAAAPRQENTRPVMPIAPSVAQPVDPAAELFSMLEAQAARSTPPTPTPRPVQAPQPIEATRPAQGLRPARAPQPIAPQAVKPAQRPAHAAASRRKKLSPAPKPEAARADVAPAKTVTMSSFHAEPTGRAAAPKPGKPAGKALGKALGKASRRKNADLPPLPPALMETANHDGPTPPLDFIPRPQALRPRVQDIRQDESLDGVQDILARLARHG